MKKKVLLLDGLSKRNEEIRKEKFDIVIVEFNLGEQGSQRYSYIWCRKEKIRRKLEQKLRSDIVYKAKDALISLLSPSICYAYIRDIGITDVSFGRSDQIFIYFFFSSFYFLIFKGPELGSIINKPKCLFFVF